MENSEWFAIAVTVVAVTVGIGLPSYLALRFYNWFQRRAQQDLERISSTHQLQASGEGECITFHTYHGFLFWATQTKHVIPVGDRASAQAMLDDLKSFSQKWATFAFGFGFIPILVLRVPEGPAQNQAAREGGRAELGPHPRVRI